MDSISLEFLLSILVQNCDGAKKRDGYGFSRADSQDGMRLGGIIKRRLPLNTTEVDISYSLLAKYSKQLLKNFSESEKKYISKLIGEKNLPIAMFSKDRKPINYAYLSSQQKFLYIEINSFLNDYKQFTHKILQLKRICHGKRKTYVVFQGKMNKNIFGKSTTVSRWRVSYSGSVKRQLLSLLKQYDFIIDPTVFANPSQKRDALLRNEVYAYYEDATRNSITGKWLVLDFSNKNEAAIAYIKNNFRVYCCRKEDDYNWYILERDQEDAIKNLFHNFSIAL